MRSLEDTPLYQHRSYSPVKTSYSLLYISILILSIAPFLMAYGKFIFSAVLVSVEKKLGLSANQVEFLVSSLFLSGLVGSALAWPIGRFLGRKKGTIISALLILVGNLILSFANDYQSILIGRCILGSGIGLTGVLTLIYASELVPANIRGSSVCLLNLAFHLGLFVAYLVALGFISIPDWHWLHATALIPSIAFLVLLFYIPETPQWYISRHKIDKAKKVLVRLRRIQDAQLELENLEDSFELAEERGSAFWNKGIFKSLLIGIVLGMLMELTGLDTILYYAPRVFEDLGFNSLRASVVAGIWISFTALLFSFIAILLIDLWGRRKLLIYGLIFMVVSLFILGFLVRYSFGDYVPSGWILLCLLLFSSGFALGLGTTGFLIISEIFPYRIRSFGVSISLTVKWYINYLVGRYFLAAIKDYGEYGVFWTYALIGLGALAFVYYLVPETKGKTLEEIEEFWMKENQDETVIGSS